MKKVLMAVVAVALVAMAVSAIADTATITVSAQVVGTCRFTGTSALSFGNLPFDASGNASGIPAPLPGSATFWCTNGASYTITDDDGSNELAANANRMRGQVATAEYIAYTFNITSPTSGVGSGPSSPITINYQGMVGATYTNNTPDTYSDTITLTITP